VVIDTWHIVEYDIEPLSPKRACAPCAPFASRESSATLSDLSDNDFEQTPMQAHEHNETTLKVEPPSPTVHNQPLVMSIGFLCSEEEKAKKEAAAAAAAAATATPPITAVAVDQKSSAPRASSHQRVHSGSPLDLLCDAIMDVEFMQAQSQRVAAAAATTDFVQSAKEMVVEEPVKQEAKESEHMHDIDAFEDSLFDDVLSNFDEFDDGISDLSSIDSDLLSEESDADTPPSSVSSNERPSMSRESSDKWMMARRRGSKQELRCLACDKPLAQKESTDAGDPVATELATWTWSPSAVFIDWFPKRCPRCERHFTIFNQEWPKRKIKTKKVKEVTITTSNVQPPSEPELKRESRVQVQNLLKDDDEDDDLFTPLVSVEKPVTYSRRQRPQKPVIHTGMLDTVSALRQVFGE
jgi:hypothetical protein